MLAPKKSVAAEGKEISLQQALAKPSSKLSAQKQWGVGT
jgi:hypothetical protein